MAQGPSAARLLLAALIAAAASADSPPQPVLPTAGRARVAAAQGSTAAQRRTEALSALQRPFLSRRSDEKAALRKVRDSSRAVREAARTVNRAKRRLADARRRASGARDQLVRLEQARRLATGSGKDQDAVAAYERRLFFGRCRVLCCLLGFTFMNGLARRSLSASGPSLVAEGLIGYPYIESIFMIGFEVFAMGKLLAVPTLVMLGPRLAVLLQIGVMGLACLWYLVAPQLTERGATNAWIVFRIFSAMAVSSALPFVGNWFPRPYYGRIFALLFAGFQAGYITCSFYWGHLLATNRLHWRVPLQHCVAGYAILFAAAVPWMQEGPPRHPTRAADNKRTEQAGFHLREGETSQELYALCHKLATRWVFWAMLIYCVAYSPAVEYSTHVISYLKEMNSPGSQAQRGSPQAGFVCLQSALCEGRYRAYVYAYTTALLLGGLIYDRASQLDRAFLVVGLLLINLCCWLALALAEPDAPAPAWVKTMIQTAASSLSTSMPAPALSLSVPTKTALTALAGATIALPSSLPFAIFSLDFGKEGAAVLSSILQMFGSLSALAFLKGFPAILRTRGWFGVHALLALLGLAAAVSMGSVMFADSQKFARGYVIRSSLLNESVVTLHACSRPECALHPMWRPGRRRAWGPVSGWQPRPYAPSSVCHRCGRGDRLVECSVDEAAAAAALLTPFDECGEWIRAEKPLRKPKQGWEFEEDPTQFPLWDDELFDDHG